MRHGDVFYKCVNPTQGKKELWDCFFQPREMPLGWAGGGSFSTTSSRKGSVLLTFVMLQSQEKS